MGRSHCCLPVIALLLFISSAYNTYATDLAAPVSYAVGKNPAAIITGDFNSDGKADLAVANSGSRDISVLLGKGDGTFRTAINSMAGPAPHALVAADFNRDGKLDLVVLSSGDPTKNIQGTLNLLLGNGDGTFQKPVQLHVDEFPLSLAVGDLNGDGVADVVVGDQASETLTLLLGNGDGNFQAATTISLGTADAPVTTILVDDFNGDGKFDLVASINGGPVILPGNGDGSFQAAVHVGDSTFGGGTLLAADFNGDHKPDLVQVTFNGGCNREFCLSFNVITLYFNNGDGTFKNGIRSLSFGRSAVVAAGDFNADQKTDLFVQKGIFGFLQLGNNAGGFVQLPVTVLASSQVAGFGSFISSADLNGDGLPDVVVNDDTDNEVTVLLNASTKSGADVALTVPISAVITPVVGGSDISYDADVFNEGPLNASGVILTDAVPAGFRFVSAHPSQGTCTGGPTVTCNLGKMADPSSATVTFTYAPIAPGTFTHTLNVRATTSDANPKNNSSSIGFTSVLPAELSVSATASETTGKVGDTIAVNVTVANAGPAAATNAGLSDTITAGAHVSGLSASAGTCTTTAGQITCTYGTLPAGGKASLSYLLTIDQAGFINNLLTVGSDQPEINTVNNDATLSFDIPGFQVSPASTSLVLRRGQQARDVISVAALGSFSSAVSLSCSVAGPAPAPSCAISPVSVSPGGTATLTVSAANLTANLRRIPMMVAMALPFGVMVLVTPGCRPRRRRWCAIALLLLALAIGCGGEGGGGGPSQPSSTAYTVNLLAQSGGIQQTIPVTVTVQ